MIILKKKNKYYTKNNQLITNKNTLDYIHSLGIPPAYKNVNINLNKNAKIIVKAKDELGRSQYMYNKNWIKKQDINKQCKMYDFGLILPTLNKEIDKHLNSKEMTKLKVISIILSIMMSCNFRIGNEVFKDKYNSYGISTIEKKHIKYNDDNEVNINFVGKRGVENSCTIRDKKIIKMINFLYNQSSKNENIFKYRNDNGEKIIINSDDVNTFLKKFGDFSSKDFRTWMANKNFILYLNEYDQSMPNETENKRKKIIKNTIHDTANSLHHTPAICKKSYINKNLINLYLENGKKMENIEKFLIYLKKNCNK